MTQGKIDTAVGAASAAAGSAGLTVQWYLEFLTEVMALAAAGINVMLAAAGLYLLYLRIKRFKSKGNKRRSDD